MRGDKATVEVRSLSIPVQMTASPTGAPCFRGYGIVWDQLSSVIVGPNAEGETCNFRERISVGACARAVVDADLRCLAHHDSRLILGRRSAGTARFGMDEYGVWYEADPPETTYARDLQVLMDRGDVDGSSFSFTSIREEWTEPGPGEDVWTRDIHEMHVFEMGPVSWPAYRGAAAVYRATGPAPRTRASIEYPTSDQLLLLNQLRLAELA